MFKNPCAGDNFIVLNLVNFQKKTLYQTWVCVKALNLRIGAIALRVPLAGDAQQSG